MNVYNEEIQVWEQEQLEKIHGRYCPKKTERLFDPKKERLFKARQKCWRHWFWGIEKKDQRQIWQAHVRMTSKQRIIHGDENQITKHEYHSYGWNTW
jgi:hypothetical protein